MSLLAMSEVWENAPRLTPAHLILLLRLADGAGEHRMVWESVGSLEKRCRMGRSTIYEGLKLLKLLHVIEDVPEQQWPAEAHLYKSVVRRIRPCTEWLATPDPQGGPESGPLPERVTPTEPGVTPKGPDLGPNPRDQRSLERPSVSPSRRGRNGSPPSSRRKNMLKAAAQTADELDPAKVLGLNNEPEPVIVPQRKGPGPDTAMGLALEFKRQLINNPRDWGPSPVNLKALAASFRNWIQQGVTPCDIRTAIEVYAASQDASRRIRTAWKDFLDQRDQLLTRARHQQDRAAHGNNPDFWSFTTATASAKDWT